MTGEPKRRELPVVQPPGGQSTPGGSAGLPEEIPDDIPIDWIDEILDHGRIRLIDGRIVE